MIRFGGLLMALGLISLARPCFACEPVVPLMQLFSRSMLLGGVALATVSVIFSIVVPRKVSED